MKLALAHTKRSVQNYTTYFLKNVNPCIFLLFGLYSSIRLVIIIIIMVHVSEFSARTLGCKMSALRTLLNHPNERSRIEKVLIGRKVRTMYKDRNGMHKTFFVGGITYGGAAVEMAYGRLG